MTTPSPVDHHHLRRILVVAALVVLAAGLVVPAPARAADATEDPANWSSRRLAAQLVNVCVPMASLDAAVDQARAAVGGITLLGTTAPADLAAQLDAVGAAGEIPTLIAADEEGGTVQRLEGAIGALPSAATMGTWDTDRIRVTAHRHAERMRALGVLMSLSPVADLAVPGAYIDRLGRAFSSDPAEVASAVIAWSEGMQAAGVAPVVKHWPGHGHAEDSHVTGATVPPFDELVTEDLVPFDAALDAGTPAVMVGHLTSEGLTEPGTPATISPRALAELRARAGDDAVIVTDSLTMAAVTSVIGIGADEAAVRSLAAGADWALTCAVDATPTVDAVSAAIDDGTLPREAAVAKARRLLALKADVGLVGRAHACREPLVEATAAPDGAPADLPAADRLAGSDRYATAAAVATQTWPQGADTVFVATGADHPDALAAVPAAAAADAPILLVRPDAVPAETRAALDALDPGAIVLVGGPAAVSTTVEEDFAATAPVERVAGADRSATAAALADRLPGTGGTVYLAAGDRFADALAVGPVAAADGAPLLLVDHDRVPTATTEALRQRQPDRLVVVGGQAAVCDVVAGEAGAVAASTVERVAGSDRYATAALLARQAPSAWLTTGADFPDALAAGAAAASTGGALVLAPPATRGADTALDAARGALGVVGPERLSVVGGTDALPEEVVERLR